MAGLAVRYNVTVSRRQQRLPDLYALHTTSIAVSDMQLPQGSERTNPLLKHMHGACAQVSDIKRANGLLSDSAMFARDSVLIPTRPIVIGCAVCTHRTHAGLLFRHLLPCEHAELVTGTRTARRGHQGIIGAKIVDSISVA